MSTVESGSAAYLSNHYRAHTAYCLGAFWRYDRGHWTELPLGVLDGEVAEYFEADREINRAAVGRLRRSMPDKMRGRLAAPVESWNADPDALPCANGLLNIPQRTLTPLEAGHRLARRNFLPFPFAAFTA